MSDGDAAERPGSSEGIPAHISHSSSAPQLHEMFSESLEQSVSETHLWAEQNPTSILVIKYEAFKLFMLLWFKADDDTQMTESSLTSSHFPEAEVTSLILILFIIFMHFPSVIIHAETLISVTLILVHCRCVTGWYCLHRGYTAYK